MIDLNDRAACGEWIESLFGDGFRPPTVAIEGEPTEVQLHYMTKFDYDPGVPIEIEHENEVCIEVVYTGSESDHHRTAISLFFNRLEASNQWAVSHAMFDIGRYSDWPGIKTWAAPYIPFGWVPIQRDFLPKLTRNISWTELVSLGTSNEIRPRTVSVTTSPKYATHSRLRILRSARKRIFGSGGYIAGHIQNIIYQKQHASSNRLPFYIFPPNVRCSGCPDGCEPAAFFPSIRSSRNLGVCSGILVNATELAGSEEKRKPYLDMLEWIWYGSVGDVELDKPPMDPLVFRESMSEMFYVYARQKAGFVS